MNDFNNVPEMGNSNTSAISAPVEAHGIQGDPVIEVAGEEHEPAAQQAEKVHRFYPYSSSQFGLLPSLEWAVEGVVPAQGVLAVYGGPGSGKTVLLLDMIRCVASGQPWFGRPVKQQLVWYIALEGSAGLRLRVLAAEKHHGVPLRARFIFDGFSFLKEEDVRELLALIDAYDGVGLIVVDTLACAMPGGDENSSRDFGAVVAGARALQQKTGGAVLLVHHTGKDAKRGMRGHSVLLGAIDTAIEVTRHEDDHREWRVTKQRDAEDGQRGGFQLVRVELPDDAFGRPVHSVVIEEVELPEAQEGIARAPMGKNQRLALDLLTDHLAELLEAGEERPHLSMDEATKLVMAQVEAGPKHRKLRAQEAIKGLLAMGLLIEQDGNLLRLEDADGPDELPSGCDGASPDVPLGMPPQDRPAIPLPAPDSPS